MKTLFSLSLVALLSACALGQTVNSAENYGSLVPANMASPYLTRKARAVGDIVTIMVEESTSASYSATTSASKKDDNVIDSIVAPFVNPILSGAKAILGKDVLGQFWRSLSGGLSTGDKSTNSGAGTTTSNGRFQTRLSVIVREVLPNGNMVIEGTRMVKVNREDQMITFAGIVRSDDVRADNTILSENIAEVRITNVGKGLISDRQRRGIITRILDWLF
jgi:flagellar L-ring protein FlgH